MSEDPRRADDSSVPAPQQDALDGTSEAAARRDTQASLLSGLRLSKDPRRRQDAFDEFLRKYYEKLRSFFARKGVAADEAHDLATDLSLKLAERMQTFRYEPSMRFRSYLYSAAQRALADFWAARDRLRLAGGELLSALVEPQDLESRLQAEFDLELLEEAKRQVRAQVSDRDWEVFQRLTETAAEVDDLQASLDMTRDAVYAAKYRVLSRLKKRLALIEEQGPQELRSST